jgi:putative salt-induced outer membrane protein YdiY
VRKTLGLSDRWAYSLEANLLFLNSEYRLKNHAFESTLSYKIPDAETPQRTRHEFGLFGSLSLQKVNETTVEEKSEVVARYFFQPAGRWMFISQADWSRDRFNSVEFSSNLIAVPAYKLIDREGTRLLAGVGPSLRTESRILTTPLGTTFFRDETSFRATLYQVFQHRISPQLTFRETLLVMSPPEDVSTYALRFQASLRRMLTPHISLNLNYNYLRDQNEIFPLQSVSTLMLTFGYQL